MDKNIRLENFKLPRWDDLPTVDLYLEQVLALMSEWLGPYLIFDDKPVMTKTMINNYVKMQYVNAPVKKRYPRITVASLFVIAILKRVFTIEETARLIGLALDANDAQTSYDEFCQLTEDAVRSAFSGTTMPKVPDSTDPRYLIWSVCNSFACQLYVRHNLKQEEDRLA